MGRERLIHVINIGSLVAMEYYTVVICLNCN